MAELEKSLCNAPTRQIKATLVRAVAAAVLFPSGKPATPDFLLTSGKANRFNLSGTQCLYFSESEAMALREYERQFQGLKHGAKQPVTLFFAEVQLRNLLDLGDEATRESLCVTEKDLQMDWSGGLRPTLTQRLGEAVAAQRKISAIRYPSVAGLKCGIAGFNIAIFKSNVRLPEYVRILGPTQKSIQDWP